MGSPGRDCDRSAARVPLFLIALATPLLLAMAALPMLGLPDYATWTGIRPLEQKLRLLQRFCRDGEPDAVVLGSSISDFGVQARALSSLLSRDGRPHRVFNFSSGAVELPSLPALYRLMRTVARPRTLLVFVPPGSGTGDAPRRDVPQTPEYYLHRAPVGRVLDRPVLLSVSKRLWDLPVFRYATASRRWLVSGSFDDLKGEGADLYPLDEHGDRATYTYPLDPTPFAALQGALWDESRARAEDSPPRPALSWEERAAARELAALAESDGVTLVAVAHAPAATLLGDAAPPAEFTAWRRRRLREVAGALGARAVDVLDGFSVERYQTADAVHLNRYGAAAYTGRLAAALAGAPPPPAPRRRVPDLDRNDATTFNVFAFLLLRDGPGEGERLRLRFVRSRAVPPMEAGPLFVALRLPDDSEHVLPAARSDGGEIVADCRGLPLEPGAVLVGRLLTEAGGRKVALNQPLAEYRWNP